MFQWLFVLNVNVGIGFLCIFTHTRGEQSRVYVSNEQFDWLEAKTKCPLLTNDRNYFSVRTRLGWTNFSAKYLPWVEYLGCFKFWDTHSARYNGKEKQVTEGEQLQECIIHCNISELFGLQESICICLPNSNLTDGSVEKTCDTNVTTCSRDPFAFCGRPRVGNGKFISVYRNVKIEVKNSDAAGNCLQLDRRGRADFIAKDCSTSSNRLCYNERFKSFNTGKKIKTNWTDAFNNCERDTLASYQTVIDNHNKITFSTIFWLSNIRRWTAIINAKENPYLCVAARIKQSGDVERIIRKCRDRLPALCIDVTNTSIHASSKTSHTLSLGTTSSSRINNTLSTLQSITVKGLTRSTYSGSLRSTLSFQFESTTAALKKTASKSKVVDRRSTFSSQIVSTTPDMKVPTGRSKVVQETTSSTPDWKETTFPVVDDSTSTDLPGKDGASAILIIAIVAATILIVIVILVTIVLCRRKKNTQVLISNESLAMVGKEVMYAQVNKPTVKREKSTSSQKSQPAASDDTYDHMDHRQLRETHNPTESNYDTMRSIANAGEEENNYDHVTGTKIEPKRFIVDGASNYSHVEVECHEVKDI